MSILTDICRVKYVESLGFYKSFYDDVALYGQPSDYSRVLYFIPGFNGTPGQFRFALPALMPFFGERLYARCLFTTAFSARNPIWEKYTTQNVESRRERLISDLTTLSHKFAVVTVLASSSGFYDFVSAYTDLTDTTRSKLRLAWVAVAPDQAESSQWGDIFMAINGFTHNGHHWFCYPNHDWLQFINPECSVDKKWHLGVQKKTFFKNDLESRFYLGGLLWDYTSIDCYNWQTQLNISRAQFPIDIPAVALVATRDGYWQGVSKSVISGVIHKYLSNVDILYRPATHLWVTVPENITTVYRQLEERAPCTRWTDSNINVSRKPTHSLLRVA